jgi:hypothetical protein
MNIVAPAVTETNALATEATTNLGSPNADPNLYGPWGIPCYPTTSGYCSLHEGTKMPPVGSGTDTILVNPGAPGMPKKYQYWSVKFKPYLET